MLYCCFQRAIKFFIFDENTHAFPEEKEVLLQEGLKFKTIGLKGSLPFFEDFSYDHIELDVQQGDSWGSRDLFWNIKVHKSCSEHLIFPDENTNLKLFNSNWLQTKLSTNFAENKLFHPLIFEKIQVNTEFKNYVVINIKSYYNWGNKNIENFYNKHDIKKITKLFPNHLIILNTPKLPIEPHNISSESIVNFCLGDNSISSDKYYQECKNLREINIKQISLLKGADVIFSTQGGNTPLSMYCNDDVRILMRGGFDYPDYFSIAKQRKMDFKIGYSVDQLY